MDRIFTPWRLDYLLSARADEGGCVFCDALESDDDRAKLILHRGRGVFVILNLYPYNNGHVMVVFRRHLGALSDATPEERGEMMESVAHCEAVLKETYQADGLNVGLNVGRAAGAGVPGHLHVHLVPRWEGDNNFAAVLAGTRIIPETPQQSFARLQPRFESLEREP